MSRPHTQLKTSLGNYQAVVDTALAELQAANIVNRIWEHDHTVWKEDPTEITNRLGWLHSPENMPAAVRRIYALKRQLINEGYTNVLLMGMGGSSLAPEVFFKTFGKDAELQLDVLDSTDPGRVAEYEAKLDLSKTAFIVATKSGGTAETLSFFKYFYNQTAALVGDDAVGAHFIAITDPGSKLVTLAEKHAFRATFINDPNIGGRYAALSLFGMVPAGLIGIDLRKFIGNAAETACACAAKDNNPGLELGVIMGELAKHGVDKVTLVASENIASFGDWAEQLIAESTGKDNIGILPVTGEALGAPAVYGNDRLFVHLRSDGDASQDKALRTLEKAGHPVVRIRLRSPYDLARQYFLWMFATAVASQRISIQPFDQPNVESAKVGARAMIDAYANTGQLPVLASVSPSEADIDALVANNNAGDYISIQAYIHPTPAAETALQALRLRLRDQYKLATTIGYGPRFLHSTGQLHKGDAGNGIFIQIVSQQATDLAIPDNAGEAASAMGFDTLKNAQALGDAQALIDNNRRLLRINVGADVAAGLAALTK